METGHLRIRYVGVPEGIRYNDFNLRIRNPDAAERQAMKILILSSNNGGGHNSVAIALKQQFADQGDSVDICDCMAFISDAVSHVISFSHIFMYRHFPGLLDRSYTNTEKKNDIFQDDTVLRKFINLGKDKLAGYIQEGGYDTVICVHVFAGMMLSEAIRKYHLSLKTGIVETDYCNTPGSANNDLDYHFVAHEGMIQELIDDGVKEEQIRVTGIPVRKQITRSLEKRYAKHLFGIPEDHDHILLMGGSMGCGPIPELLDLLTARLPNTTEMSVVCGTNEKMKLDLEEAYGDNPNVHIFGYMPDMFWIYAASDIFVTKPGGICTTEAGVLGLPMVLVNVVGGCELFNLEYFTEHGGALAGRDALELASCCETLITNKAMRESMSATIRKLVNPDAAKDICARFQSKKKTPFRF